MVSRAIIAFLLIFGAGCVKLPSDPVANDHGIEDFARTDERATVNEAQWTFTRPLKAVDSNEHFVLDVLFLETLGQVTLYSHFNGFGLRDGVRVRFRRDGAHLILEMGTPDLTAQTYELPSALLSTDGRLRVRVEVHNATRAGTRVLVWNAVQSLQGETIVARPFIDVGNADFDSKTLHWIFTTHGRGALWGLEFKDARVKSAYREAPYAP